MTQWVKTVLLDRALANIVHGQWADKKNIPPASGRSIQFRRHAGFTAVTSALTEGSPPSNTAISALTAVNATIAQYGGFIQISELLLKTSMDDLFTEYGEIIGEWAGESVDLIIRNTITAGTTVSRQAVAA